MRLTKVAGGALLAGLCMAQASPPPPPTPAVAPDGAASLMQLNLPPRGGVPRDHPSQQPRAFAAATRTITSCEQALEVAVTYKADVSIRSISVLAAVPEPLRRALAARPIGRASPIYGTAASGVRVLILCPASFKLPTLPKRTAPTET